MHLGLENLMRAKEGMEKGQTNRHSTEKLESGRPCALSWSGTNHTTTLNFGVYPVSAALTSSSRGY